MKIIIRNLKYEVGHLKIVSFELIHLGVISLLFRQIQPHRVGLQPRLPRWKRMVVFSDRRTRALPERNVDVCASLPPTCKNQQHVRCAMCMLIPFISSKAWDVGCRRSSVTWSSGDYFVFCAVPQLPTIPWGWQLHGKG